MTYNGELLFAMYDSGYYRLYRSNNKGLNSSSFQVISHGAASKQDISIVCHPTKPYMYALVQLPSSLVLYVFNLITGSNIQASTLGAETTLDKCSLTINKDGTELHLCWDSKISLYPNTFNIRYRKGTINADGVVNWDNIEQVTTATNNGWSFETPTIVVDNNGYPLIIIAYRESTYYSLRAIGKNPNLPSTQSGVVNSSWRFSTVYPPSTTQYPQLSPSACVDKGGVIHVTWRGRDSNASAIDNIRYTKSIDGGNTWSTIVNITNSTNQQMGPPSITTNSNNEVFIVYMNIGYADLRMKEFKSGIWSNEIILHPSNRRNPSTLLDNKLYFERPLMICEVYNTSVEFSGKWYE